MSDHDSEEYSAEPFYPAVRPTRPHDPFASSFRILLVFASLATLGVSLWLIWVTSVVLPSRDPAHIPMWRAAALGFFAYSGLTWAYVLRGQGTPWLRRTLAGASLLAVAFGLYGIVSMVRVADSGGHFEGYLILMGIILCGHGLSGLACTALGLRSERTIKTA